MPEPVDPIDRICHYMRELYVRNLVLRKLYAVVSTMTDIAPEETKWFRIIIETIIKDIEFEAADIYSTRCEEKIRSILQEIKEQVIE